MSVFVDRPSPHYSSRAGAVIRCVILHCDASPSEAGTLSWLVNPASEVSYHVLIGRDGTMYRVVADTHKAWAAGKSVWRGRQFCNGFSLSASFANRNDKKEHLTDIQITRMKQLITDWKRLYPTIEEVTTHAAVSPGRKFDPTYAPNFNLADYQ